MAYGSIFPPLPACWLLRFGLGLVVSPVLAQTFTAVTEPVGFSRVSVPGAVAGKPARQVVAVPYHLPAIFRGKVSAIGANALTLGSVEWAADELTRRVHYIRFRSGTSVGRYFRILSHTASTLSLENKGENLSAFVVSGDAVEIFPAHTLASLFGAATVPFQTGVSESVADVVRLNTGLGWVSYFHDGVQWRTPNDTASQNEASLRPDEAVFVLVRGTSPVNLRVAGEVGVRSQRTGVPAQGQALVGNRFPVPTTLAALGLQSLSGWVSGEAASVADNVLLWNGSSWDIFYCNGGSWEKVGSFGTNAGSTPISATTGILINRKTGGSSAPVQILSNPPFTNQ